MITIKVPTFDEFDNYKFVEFKEIKIKNKPDCVDVNKITHFLPGIPQGGIGREPLKDLLEGGKKSVKSFYDVRQLNSKTLKGFKGYFVEIVL